MIYQCKDCQTEIEFDVGIYCEDCRYSAYLKPTDTHKERLANFKSWTEEEIKMWHEKYGRGWWIFDNQTYSYNIEPTWIEQYRVYDPDTMAYLKTKKQQGRPKKEKIYEDQDKGDLVCTICTNGKPQSEPMKDDDMYIAMCSGCKDFGEFVYENEL